jgi:hypothetical protein
LNGTCSAVVYIVPLTPNMYHLKNRKGGAIMAVYEVTSDSEGKIDYGASGTAAILQSAAFLLSLHIGTCPMDRAVGWEPPIDEPSPLAQGRSSAQIIEMLERSIPEMTVEDIIYEHDSDSGQLKARIKVVIDDGEI